ncbi:DUF1269 domain-containing protein [Actinocrispum wychmicini]|uniref:Putative membrane protein n=1 Tax=Actinocrispum wychmicini TaxID=1213861 RepID=A0A4R2IQB2_9PSEU|nr:DUF1269 domain-containing protein [Actinocrispum wychmicini]TCO47374.1 putative membrane protein [Actinocrispum wychmicini]
MTTLTIWRFSSADGADRAAKILSRLAGDGLINVEDAATVSWPEGRRKPKTRQLHNIAGTSALSGAFWGMLFGVIFLVPLLGAAVGAGIGALSGTMVDVGISDDLIERVRRHIVPGTSALFLLSSDAVLDRIRNAFEGETPELIYTNLSTAEEDLLRAVFTE